MMAGAWKSIFQIHHFSNKKGAHIICFRERHVPATGVGSSEGVGLSHLCGHGVRVVQSNGRAQTSWQASVPAGTRLYFPLICQKQCVILVTLYFPHCSFPCNYWMQLGSPCYIITQIAVLLKDEYKWLWKFPVKASIQRVSPGFLLTWKCVRIRQNKIQTFCFLSSICCTHEWNLTLPIEQTGWLNFLCHFKLWLPILVCADI
jgi:hypothetical protein